jgi:nitrogen fixation-related uncharacterized protein
MLPSSIIIIAATALLTAGAALLLFWAWSRGYFRDFDAQSRVIFDARDYRVARPWESDTDRAERRHRHGPPVEPRAGEWGGAR